MKSPPPVSEEALLLQAGVTRFCNDYMVEYADAEDLSCLGECAGDGDVSV